MAKQMDLNVNRGSTLKNGTNILDMTVPEQLRHRKSTGTAWFDDAVGDGFSGGLVPSTVMMLTGSPGAGKSTLLRQLADSITKAGHIALYNSGEESVSQVKMACERLHLEHGFTVGDDDQLPKLINHTNYLKKQNPGKQVILLQDSLQTLDDGKYTNGIRTSGTLVRVTEGLVDWAKETFGIVIFIGQVTKNGEFAGRNTILHAIDVRMKLYIDDQKKSDTFGERLLECGKNRYGIGGTKLIMGMNARGLHCKGKVTEWADADEVDGD